MISDSFGRAWRVGTVDVAVGVAGLDPIKDERGLKDRHGYELKAAVAAVADELASAAELVMGKRDGVPVVIVRGYDIQINGGRIGAGALTPRGGRSFSLGWKNNMDNFTVAIVGGTGNLGSALALRLGAPGVKIIIGSRDAEKAKKAVETLRPSLRAGEMIGMTNQAAVKDANFVVIAVPYEGQAQMVQDLKGQVAGKIIIDTVVPLNKVKPFVPAAGSALQEAQQILGDEAPVIGALHNISAVDLGDVDSPLGDVLVCGDNGEAKQKVMEIIQRIGATAYDAGPASNAYVIEGLTGVIIALNRKYKSKHGSIKVTGISGQSGH